VKSSGQRRLFHGYTLLGDHQAEEVFLNVDVMLSALLEDELEARTLALGVLRCYQEICAALGALQENCRALQLFQAGDTLHSTQASFS